MGQVNAVRIGILAVALVAAIAAAFLVRALISSEPSQKQAEPKVIEAPSTEVLVAGDDIELGHRMGRSDLRWQKWPLDAVAGAYVTRDDAPNALDTYAGTIARSPLLEGEPVTAGKLVSFENAGFMSALISPGLRAVSLPISPETSAGGFILPNDRVDVIMTAQRRNERTGEAQYASETFLDNIRVLAIDQTFRELEGEQVVVGKTATLEMTPAEAEAFALAQQRGQVSLSLRSLADSNPQLVGAQNELRGNKKPRAASGAVNVIRYGRATSVQPNSSGAR